MNKFIITTGDIDGIGYEVAVKALLKLIPQESFIIWRSSLALENQYTQNLKASFSYEAVSSLEEALKANAKIVEIISKNSPADWVEESAIACYQGRARALITGPLSKTEILKSGRSDMGHTDILKRISHSQNVHMGFFGEFFNVVLTTGHIPISKVAQSLTPESLENVIKNCASFLKKLPLSTQSKPIGFLGLNPHAGEEGMIGTEEQSLSALIQDLGKKYSVTISQPLVPDAAFLRSQWDKFSLYIALYHDQGLIPFKTIHGQDSGAHITLGIPFVRTSVDHGTAKDIFGLDIANPQSMIDAIRWAIRLS